MPYQLLDAKLMKRALELLDTEVPSAARLVVGDGAAMVLAYKDRQLALLVLRRYSGAEKAADFFDDLRDQEGV
jgi:hypothetical protein